jgi:hypothetical protein
VTPAGEERSSSIAALKHPWQRAELAEYLKNAANAAAFESLGEVNFIVHVFFDDHDLWPDASKEIGWMLLDSSEAAIINTFVKALEKAIGPREKPLSALRKEDWEPVAIAAKETLAAISL